MNMNLWEKIALLTKLLLKLWWLNTRGNIKRGAKILKRWVSSWRRGNLELAATDRRAVREVPEWRREPIPASVSWIKPWLPMWFLIADVAVVLLVMWVVSWFQIGPLPEMAKTEMRLAIPTLEPTTSPRTTVDYSLEGQKWLTQDEARELRQKANVINLALIAEGGAFYSATDSVVLDPGNWKRIVPVGIEAASLNRTGVTFVAYGQKYVLNVHQPFVMEQQPKLALVFDREGKLWGADLSDVTLVPVDVAVRALPVVVEPNPSLSFSFRRN